MLSDDVKTAQEIVLDLDVLITLTQPGMTPRTRNPRSRED
jgi:hypothetical protein